MQCAANDLPDLGFASFYKCFRNEDRTAYKEVFGAIEEGAQDAGGIAGPWGWAFGVASVAAGLVESAIGKGEDVLRLNVQQTIDAGALLELTNGRTWWIGQDGHDGGRAGYWDWSLEVETWGCSDARIPVQ